MNKTIWLVTAVVLASCSANANNNRDDAPDAACSTCDASTQDGGATDTDVDASVDSGAVPLPQRCVEGTPWTAGTTAFAETSATNGLAAIGAAGVRLASVDFDGDGWADLAVRKSGANRDDFGDGARATWLLRNKGDGTFEDVTLASGITASRFTGDPNLGRPGEVFAFADVDNDGDIDAYTGFTQDGSMPDGAELMLNDGSGNFALGPLGLPFSWAGEPSTVGGATWVDVDRDGRIDLWLGRGAIDSVPQNDLLFVQRDDGTFEDATQRLGLTTQPWTVDALNAGEAHTNSWGTVACDVDGNGTPDLLSASYGRSPNKLWLGSAPDADAAFTNHSVASGYAWDHRTDWSDNESARCWCTLHPDAEGCAGVPAPRITCNVDADAFRWSHDRDREAWRLGGNSGTTVCADVDSDGDMDLLTTEIVHWDVGTSADPSELLYNDGQSQPSFERPGNEVTGLTRDHAGGSWDDGDITAAVFDFDNDARPDVYIGSTDYPGTRGLLYHQRADGTFESVAPTDGIDHTRSHGIAVADYDRDGDLDVVVGHSTFRCSGSTDCYDTGNVRYFENLVGQDHNWLQLHLEGAEGTNRSAIGARVTVTTDGFTQTREVGGGHGHYGVQHDFPLHFGLGGACSAEVTIRWPDAELSEQTFVVQAGYRYDVVQGEAPQADAR